MRDIEVYGVEIRRYKNDNVEMLSTNVVGNITKASEAEISKLPSRVWSEEDFIDYLNQNGFESNVEAEKMLRSFAKESGLSVELGHGANYPTFNAKLGKKYIFGVEAPNNIKENNVRVAIPYTTLANYIGADWDSEFVKSYFQDLPQIKPSQYNVYPKWMYISLEAFHGSENWTSFQEKIQTVIDRIKYAEERRLFYVALTRTKNEIIIMTPQKRQSKFIKELKKQKNVTISSNINQNQK